MDNITAKEKQIEQLTHAAESMRTANANMSAAAFRQTVRLLANRFTLYLLSNDDCDAVAEKVFAKFGKPERKAEPKSPVKPSARKRTTKATQADDTKVVEPKDVKHD